MPKGTKSLIIANVVMFLLQGVLDDRLTIWLALWPPGASQVYGPGVGFEPWQVVTYAFLHGGMSHIFFNMFALHMFGSTLERLFGTRFYLWFYFVSVVSAALTQLAVAMWTGATHPTIGASGGVFGLLLAFGMYFPRQRIVLLFPPIPMQAWLFVTGYGAVELFLGVTGTQAGVAHFAHLGGMLGAFLMIQWRRGRPPFRRLTLSLCLLCGCASVSGGGDPSQNDARRAQPDVDAAAAPPDDANEIAEDSSPPLPEPLGPLREFTPTEWQRIRGAQRFVQNASHRQRLSASFINGMIWVETGFEARARGRRGPRGMLQLMPRTARAMARRLNRKYMPESADFSIAAGTEYVMVMYERFDRDLQLALAAYNAGPAVVMAWQEAGASAPKPRQSYVTRVERAARAFCQRLPQPRYEPDDSPFRCPAPPPRVADQGLSARRCRPQDTGACRS